MPWAPAGRDGGGARDAVPGSTGSGALRKRTIMQEKTKLCLLLPYQSSVMPINDAVVCARLPYPQNVGGLAPNTGSNGLWALSDDHPIVFQAYWIGMIPDLNSPVASFSLMGRSWSHSDLPSSGAVGGMKS